MNQQGKPPSKEFRAKGVRAAIWANEREEQGRLIVTHSVKIKNSYRDRQTGEWKDTDNYFADDLPALTLVAERAYEFIALKETEEDSDSSDVAR